MAFILTSLFVPTEVASHRAVISTLGILLDNLRANAGRFDKILSPHREQYSSYVTTVLLSEGCLDAFVERIRVIVTDSELSTFVLDKVALFHQCFRRFE